MNRLAILVLVVWVSSVALRSSQGERPKVVSAQPDHGATNVSPDLKELRIVFDQPMAPGGCSVVGGGPTFPKLIGQSRWEDAATFVWACRLEPNHDYWLSINSERFTNFRSAAGKPAIPYPIAFHTGAPTRAETNATVDFAARHREALTHLRRAITEEYSYRDRRQVDWDERFSGLAELLPELHSPREFAVAAAGTLEPAEDVHLWFEVEGEKEPIPTFVRRAEGNINLTELPRRVTHWERRSSIVATGRFDDGVRYVFVRS
jgi:hypothetical protein